MRAALIAGLTLGLGACGGKVLVAGSGAGGAATTSVASSSGSSGTAGAGAAGAGAAGSGAAGSGGAGFPPHGACDSGDGVRLCGGDASCPALPAPTCPGFGCTPAFDVASLMPSTAGVCWDDVPDSAAELCYACEDGDVCAQRDSGQLVCVSQGVCDALWDLGATDVCRYADKSRYDHQPLPEPAGPCPTTEPLFCGGACGDCSTGWRCTGRSPRHPFGICQQNGVATPGMFETCAIVNGTVTVPCILPSDYCGVFAASSGDLAASELYGLCSNACLLRAAALPGGYLCFDASGNQVQ